VSDPGSELVAEEEVKETHKHGKNEPIDDSMMMTERSMAKDKISEQEVN
jgi:hypothetical protein